MFQKKKQPDHAEDEIEEEQQINFAWIVMMGLQMGFSRQEVRYMHFGEWSDLFEEYKKIHNFKVKKMLFRTEEERVSMLDM